MNRVFSTRELAALCAVNESTIKRWADSGRLDCIKTPGGHRKFRVQDVYRFLQNHGFDTASLGGPGLGSALADTPRLPPEWTRAISLHDPVPLIVAYLASCRQGEHRAVRELMLQLLAADWTVVDICEEILTPALHDLGEKWAEGEVPILEEHLVSAATLQSLSILEEEMPRREPNGLRALCCGCEFDQHNMGVRMVSLVLESTGWSVAQLLSSIPTPEIIRYLEQSRPELLCISLVHEPLEQEFARSYAEVRETARKTGTQIAIGGRGSVNLPDGMADFSSWSLRPFMPWVERMETTARATFLRPPAPHAGTH